MSATAENPRTAGENMYHLDVRKGDIHPLCIMVGSPERAALIADTFFDRGSTMKVAEKRGYTAFSGIAGDTRMTVFTHGIGGGSVDCTLMDAILAGGQVFIRVGSSSALDPQIVPGDHVIWTSALDLDRQTTLWRTNDNFLYCADEQLIRMMCETDVAVRDPLSEEFSKLQIGRGVTTLGFWAHQGRQDPTAYVPDDHPSVRRIQERFEYLLKMGQSGPEATKMGHVTVKAIEMEIAVVYAICAMRGLPAAAVTAVYTNRQDGRQILDRPDLKDEADMRAARLAVRTLQRFAKLHRDSHGR